MDPKEMSKQMYTFNKTTFERSFSAMMFVLDYSSSVQKGWIDQNKWLPEESRNAALGWLKTMQNGREAFRTKIEDGYRQMGKYFTTPEK